MVHLVCLGRQSNQVWRELRGGTAQLIHPSAFLGLNTQNRTATRLTIGSNVPEENQSGLPLNLQHRLRSPAIARPVYGAVDRTSVPRPSCGQRARPNFYFDVPLSARGTTVPCVSRDCLAISGRCCSLFQSTRSLPLLSLPGSFVERSTCRRSRREYCGLGW